MKKEIKRWINKTIVIKPIDEELNSEFRRNIKDFDNAAAIGIIAFFKTIYYAQFFAFLGTCIVIATIMFLILTTTWILKKAFGCLIGLVKRKK